MWLRVMGGRGPLKSMGRPDGCTAAGGLAGIYGAERDLWGWDGCGRVRRVSMGLERELWGSWGAGGFYGAGVERMSRGPLKSMGRTDGCTAAGGLGGDLWGWEGSMGLPMGQWANSGPTAPPSSLGGGAMGEGYGAAVGLGGIYVAEGNGGERPIEVYG